MTVPSQFDFNEPVDEKEAEDRKTLLLEEIQDIEMQLGDQDKVDPETGERMESHRYHVWRQKARYALRIKKAEYSYLGRWLKRLREQHRSLSIMRAVADPFSAEGLLKAAFMIFKSSFHGGVSPFVDSEDDQAVIDAIKDYLEGKERTRIEQLRDAIDGAMPLILQTFPIDEYKPIKNLVVAAGWAGGEPSYYNWEEEPQNWVESWEEANDV